jgi:hypothetical protein
MACMLYDLESGQTHSLNEEVEGLSYWRTGNGRCDEIRGFIMGLWDCPARDFKPTYKRILIVSHNENSNLEYLNPYYDQHCFTCYTLQMNSLRRPHKTTNLIIEGQKFFRGDKVRIVGIMGMDMIHKPQSGEACVVFSHGDIDPESPDDLFVLMMEDGALHSGYPVSNLQYLYKREGENYLCGEKSQFFYRGDVALVEGEECIVLYRLSNIDIDSTGYAVSSKTGIKLVSEKEMKTANKRVGEQVIQDWKMTVRNTK